MIPIKNFERDARQCKHDWCTEVTCAQHPRAEIEEALPGLFGVPTERCGEILSQIADDKHDVVMRYWMKKVFIEKKRLPYPSELREIAQREGVEDAMPFSVVEAILDAHEWPPKASDERRKKALEDFRRELFEHSSSTEQVSFAGHGDQRHNVQVQAGRAKT